ncbi:MAG: hypothetical protein Q3977_05805, partial [Oscillospiraceae bacterium]|nr:hypothetical protein [Oscillospiraceae bacterium]
MFGFLFRKSIFDGWDHILGLFLANIGYLALLASGALWWYLNGKEALELPLTILLIIVTIVMISFYTMGIAGYAANIIDGAQKGKALKGVISVIKTHIRHVLFHAFITLVIVMNLLFALPFYMSIEGFLGPLMAFVGLFLALFLLANFKYYLPLCLIRSRENVVEIIKFSFAYALDNNGTTLVLLLRSAADLLLSIPLAGILPGFAGIILSDTCATAILNRRY